MSITLKHSKQGFILFAILHIAAMASVFSCNMVELCKIFLLLMCLFNFWLVSTRYVLLTARQSIVQLTWLSDWQLSQKNGQQTSAICLGDSVVTRFIAILNFTVFGQRRAVILFPDMLPADTFRKLRMRLSNGVGR